MAWPAALSRIWPALRVKYCRSWLGDAQGRGYGLSAKTLSARGLFRGCSMRPRVLERVLLSAVKVRVRRRDVALLVLVHPGGHPAELHNQDGDTERARLHGQRLADRLQRVLTRRVDAVEREHRQPGGRGHV